MKPVEFKEFKEIKRKFIEEQKYWEALKVGDTVYESFPIGYEVDYFEAKILSIDINERFIIVEDKSSAGYKENKLHHFTTQVEFEKLKL